VAGDRVEATDQVVDGQVETAPLTAAAGAEMIVEDKEPYD
jgi:hypothetical protein